MVEMGGWLIEKKDLERFRNPGIQVHEIYVDRHRTEPASKRLSFYGIWAVI